MKQNHITALRILMAAVGLAFLAAGCATSQPGKSSTHAERLKPTEGAGIDLSRYRVATVLPFKPANSDIDASVGVKFAEEVGLRLQSDYGPIFNEVRRTQPPLGTNNELIVTGTIKEYKPGDKSMRLMIAGAGAVRFKGDLILKDGADNRVLFTAPFDKLWAWGGFLGASKDIQDMMSESEASAAATVAHAKGWQPPAK
jgi:hypothetical protein